MIQGEQKKKHPDPIWTQSRFTLEKIKLYSRLNQMFCKTNDDGIGQRSEMISYGYLQDSVETEHCLSQTDETKHIISQSVHSSEKNM